MNRISIRVLNLAAWFARRLPRRAIRSLYRIRPIASMLRSILNSSAPDGLTRVSIASGALEGFQMALDLRIEKDYWLGSYEPELQDAVLDLARPGMVAFDVGANIGYTSLLLAKAVGESGRVFAFEALPSNIARLRQNLSLNGQTSHVEICAGAVVDRPGQVLFITGPSGSTGQAEGSAGRIHAQDSNLFVPGISLDSFVYSEGNPAPAIAKMDIEGGEVRALPGMGRLLDEAGPILLLELHGPEAAHVAWEALTSRGYRLSRMGTGYPPITTPESLDWKAYVVARK